MESGALLRRFDTDTAIPGLAISPDGQRLLSTAMTYGPLVLWEASSGLEIRQFADREGSGADRKSSSGGFAAIWGPDDHTVIYGSVSGDVIWMDVDTGDALRVFRGHDVPVFGIDNSPDWRYLLSGDAGSPGQLILWDFATGQEVRRFYGHTEPIVNVFFSPDGQTAFTSSYDGTVIQWQITDWPLDKLLEWMRENRYVRDFTCEERAEFNILPLCETGAP